MAAASRNHQQALKQAFRISGRSTPGVEEDKYLEEPETRRSPVPKIRTRATSVPVKVPDRPKILMHDIDQYNYSNSNSSSSYDDHWIDDDDDDEEEEEEVDVARLLPHEMVMRRRGASPSVVEGAGRTLKGRDMIRVRNAIWTQIGFQD